MKQENKIASEWFKLLPYDIEKYPKGENVRYDASYRPTVQTALF